MGIVIDIIIILFILASTYLGYKKGLVKVAVSMIAFLVAILITVVLYRPIANLIIDNTDLDEKLQQMVEKNLDSVTANRKMENNEEGITKSILDGAKKEIVPGTSRTIAINIFYGITMIALFIVSRLLLILINLLADTITSLPILKQFNEAGGIAYGLLRGMIIVYVILIIINILISLDSEGNINNILQSSIITKNLINYNLFNVFLSK